MNSRSGRQPPSERPASGEAATTTAGLDGPAAQPIPDVVAPRLRVLFCGINPGLLSGAMGQHFARPGNRFWKVLHAAGFTERILSPADQWQLLDYQLGITNLVAASTRAASEVGASALRAGAVTLADKVAGLEPAFVAVLGMQAYRTAFHRPHATVGHQTERLAAAQIWLLPNPSGLQARYGFPEMVALFGALRVAAGVPTR